MSDSSGFPSNVNLEYFRKQAKKLLRDCREGKAPAIARVRLQLPRIQSLAPEEIALRLKLADVQHAIAREQAYCAPQDRLPTEIDQCLGSVIGDRSKPRPDPRH